MWVFTHPALPKIPGADVSLSTATSAQSTKTWSVQPKRDKTDRDWSKELEKAVDAKNDDVFGMLKGFYDPPTDGGFGCAG